ncbi:hypothetical protein [Solibacillus cecembensis]|uniref:hypothetical protein n=1 Tax=Solibacillus cecembensis TaxID=459347 RepID=UPI003CFC31AD
MWGIVEKFKLANSITGESFFNTFSISHNSKFSKNLEGQSSLYNFRHLDVTKLNSIFGIDFEHYSNNFLNKLNISNLNIPIFHKELFFCEKCLSNSYHSIFHQLIVVEFCPYHPDIKITNLCPSCSENFRYYNIGSFEKAFCCENCGFSVNDDLFSMKIKKWVIYPRIVAPVYKFLNIKGVGTYGFHFIFVNRIKKDARKFSYTKTLELLNEDFENLKKPFCKDKTSEFQLRYSNGMNINRCYNFKEIMPGNSRFVPFFIDKYLDLLLFNQSKAILKSVEKYILKKFNKKVVRSLKKSYGPTGYLEEKALNSPFIVWKNECYGKWIYDIKYGDYKKFDQKNSANKYEKQIFPYLYYADDFRQDLMEITPKIDSFSLIFNLFSKLLFVYLYDRYLEIKNTFAIADFEIISTHVIVNHKNKYIFI